MQPNTFHEDTQRRDMLDKGVERAGRVRVPESWRMDAWARIRAALAMALPPEGWLERTVPTSRRGARGPSGNHPFVVQMSHLLKQRADRAQAASISARYKIRKWHCTVAPDAFPSLSRPVAEPVQRPGHAVHRPCHTRARQARGAWEHGAAGGSNAVVVNEEHHAMTCAGSTARPEETTYGLKAIAALSVMY